MSTLRTNNISSLDGSVSYPVGQQPASTISGIGIVSGYSFSSVADILSSELEFQDGDSIETDYFYDEINGGGAKYRVASSPESDEDGWSVIDIGNGLYAELVTPKDTISCHVAGLVADYIPGVSLGSDQAGKINEVLAYAKAKQISRVEIGSGYYCIMQTIDLSQYPGVTFECPVNAFLDDDDYGDAPQAILVGVGTGPKVHSIKDDDLGAANEIGGEVDNPSSDNAYTATHGGRSGSYRVVDFTNGDASGATRATARMFSCVLKCQRRSSIHGIFVTHNSNGDIARKDSTATFGDEWDIGMWFLNGERVDVEKATVAGYFRMFAAVMTSATDVAGGITAQAEFAVFRQCNLRGYRGFGWLSTTDHTVTASTANTVSIAWTSSHRWPSSGEFAAFGTSQVFSYTGLSYNSGDDTLTFTGVTPDSSGVSGQVYYDNTNFGLAGARLESCQVTDLSHASGRYCVDDFFGDEAFSHQSTALEIRGHDVRQPELWMTKLYSREDVILFTPDSRHLKIWGGFWEAKSAVDESGNSLPRGTRVVALNENSPRHNGRRVSKGARSQNYYGLTTSYVDFRPAWPIKGSNADAKFGSDGDAVGLCDPKWSAWPDVELGFVRENVVATGDNSAINPLKWDDGTGAGGVTSQLRRDSVDGLVFPVGQTLAVYTGGTNVNRRAIRSFNRSSGASNEYTIFSGDTVQGDWRCLGKCGETSDGLAYHLFQRVS